MVSGDYGDPPRLSWYINQLIVYMFRYAKRGSMYIHLSAVLCRCITLEPLTPGAYKVNCKLTLIWLLNKRLPLDPVCWW
jgi:hypothetical protein